jgi:hypothetical protein
MVREFLGAPRLLPERAPYLKPNALLVLSHLMIPKAQNFDSLPEQEIISSLVTRALVGESVSATIQFHCKPNLDTKEIEEVNTARILTTEFEFRKATIAQQMPEASLRIS